MAKVSVQTEVREVVRQEDVPVGINLHLTFAEALLIKVLLASTSLFESPKLKNHTLYHELNEKLADNGVYFFGSGIQVAEANNILLTPALKNVLNNLDR